MDTSMRIRLVVIKRKQERLQLIRRRRELRDYSDPFSISEAKFQELFRFPKHLAKEFIIELTVFLNQRHKIHGLPCILRILIAIQFYATGSHQRIVGEGFFLAVSQTSVSRCIREVSQAINDHLLAKYIEFPQTSSEINEKKSQFYQQHGFPGVIGCIDATHVLIKKPERNIEHVYICENGGYSKNIQIICDANLSILSINPKFGGATHDAFVWKSSLVHQHLCKLFQKGERCFWLLGDNGYPQQPWLMTPIINAQNDNEKRYNVMHKTTRNCIERCIGMLKGRFRCLSKEKFLWYSPSESGVIINACSVLHNIFIRNNITMNESDIDVPEAGSEISDDTEYMVQQSNHLIEGKSIRDDLVEEYF